MGCTRVRRYYLSEGARIVETHAMIFDDGGTTLAYVGWGDAGAAYVSTVSDSPSSPVQILARGSNAATINYITSEIEKVYSPHFAKLQRIPFEPDLWVTGAPAPSPRALGWAHAVLNQLKEIGSPPSRVVASAEGGVAICFVDGKKYADIECLNSGSIIGVVSDGHGRPTAWEIKPDPNQISQASLRIRKFLNSPTP
jgi:hypothetical protein